MPTESQLPARFNAADRFILPNLTQARAARPYLLCGEERLTYGDLHRQANRIGGALKRLGVEPENRVMLLMGESLTFASTFWAILRIGAVALPVNPALTPAEQRLLLDESRAKVLIADSALWPRLAPLCRDLRHLRHVVANGAPLSGLPQLLQLAAAENGRLATEPTRPDDAACWLYTSGSTGTPKAAVHLHRALAHAGSLFPQGVLGLTAADLGFSAARMHFAYGMGNSLLFPAAVGGAAAIDPAAPTPESLFGALERYRPTVFYAGPTHFAGMLATHRAWRQAGCRERPLPTLGFLRYAVSAGEALPPEIYREWRNCFGSEILDCAGSTENLTFFLANRPGESRPGSAGNPVPGFELRLVDTAGRNVAPGEAGALWVKGPTAAARYWNRSALTRATMRGEWLVTGDRFRRDEEGHYRFLGREDDMFKAGGSWVSPVEVERALMTHGAVAECAVTGKPNGSGLTEPVAVIVPTPDFATGGNGTQPALAESLRAHLHERLAPFKVPRRFEFAAALPRTPTGKVRRFELRRGGDATSTSNAAHGTATSVS